MAYTWFRVESSVADHPKTMALEVALDEPLAIAYVLRFWCWVQRYAPLGQFKYALAPSLERALRWPGAQGKLISTFVDVGWLEDTGEGVFEAHDWSGHQGSMVSKSIKDSKEKRKIRTAAARERRENGAISARAAHAPGAPTDGRTDGHNGRTDITDGHDAPPPRITTVHIVERPTTAPEGWTGDEFWRWFQFKRQEAGFHAEPGPPRAVGRWYSVAMQTVGGNVEVLQEAMYRFGDDRHWQKATPALPWAAFQKLWTNFLPRGAVNDSP